MEEQCLNPSIAVIVTVLGVLGYLSSYKTISNFQFIRNEHSEEKKSIAKEITRRLSGFIFLGAVPICITYFLFQFPVPYLELPQKWSISAIVWSVVLMVFVLIVPLAATTQAGHLKKYPQMRVQKWGLQMTLLNSLTWAAQLFSYELLFRGILLFITASSWGEWAAILINAVLYSLAHFSKGWKETLGSFPFAILLCLVSLATGSIWVAVVAHIIIALGNDIIAIHKNPSMHFNLSLVI